ncbi:uncharacterized protein LOC132714642 [Ruditapes philippinarum]|uniref:uncharacterized protein LOC132714642 n=1 Tax=Ruditapes philippinarum TaxID=129788 RepID=UPI00295BB8E9|nr:uncharacterized protein LOC132714642 [Ruditapes philippinarum]
MADNQPDLVIDESRQSVESSHDESQQNLIPTKGEVISDDQELFLKVLENLKNAVTKPESHVALQRRPATYPGETSTNSNSLNLVAQISENESQNYIIRSDVTEPGTTTVTVSDITKSRILQKLACEKTVNSVEKQSDEHTSLPVITPLHVNVSKKESASSSNFGRVTSENDGLVQKSLYSERAVSFVKTSLLKPSEKLERGSQKQNSPSVQLYPCNYCDYYSDNKSYLKQHVDFVHISDRPFKCPYCEYAGKRSHALREHLIVHTDERPFQCTVCKATFRKKGHLTNHVKLHNSKRLVKCPLCKALVYDTGENGLDAHLKNDHDTERLYGCDLCEHIAANEPDIIKHLRQTHKTKIVSHKCDKCPYETANSVDFIAHENAHKMAENKVHIGENAPTSVLGVATFMKGSEHMGAANTIVKMNIGESNPTTVPKQPAVIKPVWIKCSECGFTGQDSEVIRTHMLEHLKEQGLEVIPESHIPVTSSSSVREQIVTCTTEPKQTVTELPNRSESNTNSQQTPILVPVTNMDFLQKHASSLDMTSPILVPVTDTEMLKRLQQSAIQHIGAKSNAITVVAQNNSQMPKSTATATSASEILKQKNLLAFPGDKEFKSVTRLTTPSKPFLIVSKANNVPERAAGTFSSQSIEQIVQNSSVKVIPMSNTISMTSSVRPSIPIITSSTVPLITSSSHSSSLVQGMKDDSLLVPGQQQHVQPITLTQIPIPRTDAPTSPPKLPPELINTKTPFDEAPGAKKPEIVKVPIQGANVSTNEEKLLSLKESLANVQRLIEQQEKISKRIGGGSLVKDVVSGKSGGKNVIFYVEPVSNQNLPVKSSVSSEFTHDSTVGKFKCTLCGYCCDQQRTIKAHIWKHSGNKNIDYPMFQNGPLSVYDDELPTKVERNENIIEIITSSSEVSSKPPVTQIPQLIKSVADVEPAKVPPFIVYENTKISNVAPALAHLIAARTMAGMKKKDSDIDSTSVENSVSEDLTDVDTQERNNCDQIGHNDKENKPVSSDSVGHLKSIIPTSVPDTVPRVSQNVVVESIVDVSTSAGYTGYTGLQSQQNSPRVGARSPDSGITEMTVKTADDATSGMSSELISPVSNAENVNFEMGTLRSGRKRGVPQQSLNIDTDDNTDNLEDSFQASSSKRVKVLHAHEDSAVTLLSLLKKGPNFNPACPPMTTPVAQQPLPDYSNVSSPGQDDSNSIGESEMSGSKPKSGISTSLLAVIEQLRERSKSDADDDKPVPPQPPPKKMSKRRSRKSSQEDNTPASGIENVEEFFIDGEVRFRCKLCHYTNESTVLLRQHMRLHKPKQEFECSLCDLIAESSEALQDHMIQHCKVRTYQCKLCNSTFNYKSQLRAHMRMHNDQDILFCDYCDFETRNLSGMKLHMKSHLTKPPYKCDSCQEDFVSSYNLRIHKRDGCNSSADKSNTSFKCDECDFVFFGRREMKNHQRLHMGRSKSVFPIRCPYCEHSDSSIENVQKHVAEVHGESKPLRCDMCGFFAVSIRSLKSHMKRHVNDQRFVAQPLEQYKCNLCGYVCHHLPSLKSHMWRHAADQHYSYEFTNDVINAAIDFDGQTDVSETTKDHVDKFKVLIFDKMKAKGLENTHPTLDESAMACCWVTFRCCQCGFETINKAELNMHMSDHSDVIKMTLEIGDQTVIIDNQGNEVEVS